MGEIEVWLHLSLTSPLGRSEYQVSIEQDAMWATEPAWMFWKIEISLALVRIET